MSELIAGFEDKGEEGVRGYGGRLNIRPAYQREFIYGEKQRNEVIHTIRKKFPLNTMYWVVAGEGFELMDGQQRTISICQYVQGDFSVAIDGSPMNFGNLTDNKRQEILDYELSIYVCEGSDSEKLDWFKIINIAGKPLTEHQHDQDAQELWQYWQAVFDWVKRVFPNQDSARAKLMKGLPWGVFYNDHKDDKLNAAKLEQRIAELIEDDEVNSKKGIYEFLLTGNEKTLSLRAFDEKTKVKIYEKQKGVCPVCKKHYDIGAMESDHIIPWSQGGKTTPDNCQMLCKMDNRTKSGK